MLKVTGHEQLLKLVLYLPRGCGEDAGTLGCGDRPGKGATAIAAFRPARTKPLEGSTPSYRVGWRGSRDPDGMILPASQRAAVIRALLEAYHENLLTIFIPSLIRRYPFGAHQFSGIRRRSGIAGRCRRSWERRWCATERRRQGSRVALCGGSGGSLIEDAVSGGAGIFIAGDFRFHDLEKAQAHGLGLIDAGHGETEELVIEHLAAHLRSSLHEAGLKTEVVEATPSPPRWLFM